MSLRNRSIYQLEPYHRFLPMASLLAPNNSISSQTNFLPPPERNLHQNINQQIRERFPLTVQCQHCQQYISILVIDEHQFFCHLLKQDCDTKQIQQNSTQQSQQFNSQNVIQPFGLERQEYFIDKVYQLFSSVENEDLLRKINEINATTIIPAEHRRELFNDRIKYFQNNQKLFSKGCVKYTSIIEYELFQTQQKINNSQKKLRNMISIRKNNNQCPIQTNQQSMNHDEQFAINEANEINEHYLFLIKRLRERIYTEKVAPELPQIQSVKKCSSYETFGGQITVNRQNILDSTENKLWEMKMNKKLRKTPSCEFRGEIGVDSGGLRKEWISLYFNEVIQFKNGVLKKRGAEGRLFVWGDDNRRNVNRRRISQFSYQGYSGNNNIELPEISADNKFNNNELKQLLPWWTLGAMLGFALMENISVPCRLEHTIWRMLLGQIPSLEDAGLDGCELADKMRQIVEQDNFVEQLGTNFEITVEEEEQQQFDDQDEEEDNIDEDVYDDEEEDDDEIDEEEYQQHDQHVQQNINDDKEEQQQDHELV